MSANHRYETLGDIRKHSANVACRCACGHASIVDGAKLSRWYFIHLWDTRLLVLGDHLRCSQCGRRPDDVRPTAQLPNAPDRFPKDEDGWKRAVRKLRG